MTVVIASDRMAPVEVSHPGFLTPVAAESGAPDGETPLPAAVDSRWQPEVSPTGPVTVVVSGADRRILVLRNGLEIGRTKIVLADPATALGTVAFVLKESGTGATGDRAPAGMRWMGIALPGSDGAEVAEGVGADPNPAGLRHGSLRIAGAGGDALRDRRGRAPATTGPSLNVLNSDPPPATPRP